MPKDGLLIEYHWCTGCHTCELACKQEHNLPVGRWGIRVREELFDNGAERLQLEYIPIPTDLCNLCEHRTSQGLQPSCAQHCQTRCIHYGNIEELSKNISKSKEAKFLLWAPKPS